MNKLGQVSSIHERKENFKPKQFLNSHQQLQLIRVGVNFFFAVTGGMKEEGRKRNPHLASNKRNLTPCLKLGGCCVGVWRVSGICLKGVWRLL